jgi:predicted metal-dependent peptidase
MLPTTTSITDPESRLAIARLRAVQAMPYFAHVLLALVPRQSDQVPTIGVTAKMVMFWNPTFVMRVGVAELGSVLLHEANHVIRNHNHRCVGMGAEHARWNIAADLEINDDLAAAKCPLPVGSDAGVFPSDFGLADGLMAEEYYRKLPVMQPQPGGAGSGQGQGSDGQGHAHGGVGHGKCGSIADGDTEGEPDDGGTGRGSADIARVQKQTAQAIKDHVAQNGRGSVPAALERWADEALKPARVRWEDKLACVLRGAVAWKAGSVDRKFTRPSRRQAGIGFGPGRPVLAGLVAPVPRVMVAIDTSGSMGNDELARALAECSGVLRAVGGDVDFVSCDCDVNAVVKARHWKDVAKKLIGGGGTDFVPVFEIAAQPRHRPDILVFITDGCGPAPAQPPPGLRVVWVLVGPYKQRPYCAGGGGPVAYGDVVEIDEAAA